MNSVQEAVFDLIAKEAPVERERITLNSTLQDLDVGSLTAVEISFAIEDHFDIDIPDRDPNFDASAATVAGLVSTVQQLVDAKLAAKPAQA
jgi:acyl carrier protein